MEVGDALYGVTMRGDGVSDGDQPAAARVRLSQTSRRHEPSGAPASDPRRLRRLATATTRWADDDVYGHMNNATLLRADRHRGQRPPARGDRSRRPRRPHADRRGRRGSCRYFREIGFPEPVDLGLAVERVGTSSVIYRIGLFQGDADEAAAEGRFVHVYVDNADPARPAPDPRPRAGRRGGDPR